MAIASVIRVRSFLPTTFSRLLTVMWTSSRGLSPLLDLGGNRHR